MNDLDTIGMSDLSQLCVNGGGPESVVVLDCLPQLGSEVRLSERALAALHHWQTRPGEILSLVDNEANTYRARITSLDPKHPACVPFEKLSLPTEHPLTIQIYHSLPERERFELVLQKTTELGVDRIVPMESRRSITLSERDSVQKKSHRWPDVVLKAARQCRRAMLPELMPVLSFERAVQLASSAELKLILYEGETFWRFTEGINSHKPHSVALMVGPEGGFASEEIQFAQKAGFLPVTLGPRILRTETAAIVATALIQSYLGDLK